jgi:hypothetical protein
VVKTRQGPVHVRRPVALFPSVISEKQRKLHQEWSCENFALQAPRRAPLEPVIPQTLLIWPSATSTSWASRQPGARSSVNGGAKEDIFLPLVVVFEPLHMEHLPCVHRVACVSVPVASFLSLCAGALRPPVRYVYNSKPLATLDTWGEEAEAEEATSRTQAERNTCPESSALITET